MNRTHLQNRSVMKYNFNELAETVQQAKNGNPQAFVTLYEQTYQKSYFLAFSILKNKESAEDAVQEVFANVYINLHKLEVNKTFIAWLNRITYTTCMRILEKNKLAFSYSEDLSHIPDTDKSHDPLEMSTLISDNESLCNLIRELDTPLRVTIILKYYKDMKIKDIAKVMRCPEGTVKSRLNTSKKILKTRILQNQSGNVLLGGFTLLPIKTAVDLYIQQSYVESSFSPDFVAGIVGVGAVSGASAISAVAPAATSAYSSVAIGSTILASTVALSGVATADRKSVV